MKKTVAEIARLLGGKVIGDGNKVIGGVADTGHVTSDQLTFADNELYLKEAEARQAGVIVVAPTISSSSCNLIQVSSPRVAFAKILAFAFPAKKPAAGVHPTAVIAKGSKVSKKAAIGPYVVIEEGAAIADGVAIGAGSYIGENVAIGDDTVLDPSVVIYARTVIGKRVIIHSGTVIGGDGFGYADEGEKRVKIPQIGNVVIEDDVELGNNVCIDRATLGSTIVKKGTKVDNLVQIAHNDIVGENVLLCAQVGISGSSVIGNNVILTGQVGIADHVEIGDHVILGAQSGVPTKKKIPEKTVWFGTPARPIQEWKEIFAHTQRLPEAMKKLQTRIAELESKIAILENQKDQVIPKV